MWRPGRWKVILLACVACSDPSSPRSEGPPEIDSFLPGDTVGGPVGFRASDASLTVNGRTFETSIDLEAETFVWLYVFVTEGDTGKLFLTSPLPFTPSVPAGSWRENELRLSGGVDLTLESRSGHLLTDDLDRTAWLELVRDYRMFAPGTEAADLVVGLASTRLQIPGWDRQGG